MCVVDNSNSIAFKGFDVQSKVNNLISNPGIKNILKNVFITLLNEDQEFQESVKTFFEYSMATSDLNVLNRLAVVEEKLGIVDYGLDEAPTIPERLDILESKVNTHTSTIAPVLEPEIQPSTKTEKRAFALVNYLRKKKKRFLTSAETIAFLRTGIEKDCQCNDKQKNIRQTKKEVLEKAAELFPNVQLNKATHGRHEVRLVLS